ncbi:MAG: hypothetical protein M1827_006347 [Pycnora praestabilis]|nr:MAG: hypothetical protein M1827_006347 [Pycnora praestabilis]
MAESMLDPSPPETSRDQARPIAGPRSRDKMPRPRRRSSGLGADIRGDTGAPAVSTLDPASPPSTPQLSPRKVRSLFRRWKDLSFQHTWVNPLVILVIVLSGYAINPTPSNPIHSAIYLSYAIPRGTFEDATTPTQYGKGPLDFAFVGFYIVVLSFTREFLMQSLIRPLAVRAGIKGRAKQSRFMEQVYTAMYFSVLGPFGLYVMSRTPVWYFNTTGMFEGFPHRSHEGVFKTYYLLQASYWAQQAIVLMLRLEKPRKDFKELVWHHIITLALIGLSYRFHFTYMGLAVYITHDISDFFLATSKTLNYLDSILIGPYFALFVSVWIYLRHYLNLTFLWATLTKFSTVGPFELNWETQQYKCRLSQAITFSLLASLQAVNLFWLFLILRIAKHYVFKRDLEDVRSDNEEDDELSIEEKKRDVKVLLNGEPVKENGTANGYVNGNGGVKKNRQG